MKKFRRYEPNQLMLLPPAINDWLPKGHLAHFVSDVIDSLDLSEIIGSYDEAKGGQPPYHPVMMVKLLCYGYCVGLRSSRKIEQGTWESIPFRVLSNDQHPDHDTIASFRERHLSPLAKLFEQVLAIAIREKLVDLEHVSVDGTKVAANAGINRSMSMEKVNKKEDKLKELIAEILEEARRIDKEENAKYGDKSSYLLPEEYQDQEFRLKKIQELKQRMEQEKKEIEETKKKKKEEQKTKKQSRKKANKGNPNAKGRARKNPPKEDTIVRNSTDYDSRIMRGQGGNWGQSYNAQVVVDSKAQVIVVGDVTNQVNDQQQLVPTLTQVEVNTGKKPKYATADAGYFSNNNVSAEELNGIDLIVSVNEKQERKSKRGELAFVPSDEMREKLAKPHYKELYRKRKQIVEPVFGQIKDSVLKFDRFTFRGLQKVRNEWKLVCTIHNLMKLYRSEWRPA